jgi:hypothetical protein
MVFSTLQEIETEIVDFPEESKTKVEALIGFIEGIMRIIIDPLNSTKVKLIQKIFYLL